MITAKQIKPLADRYLQLTIEIKELDGFKKEVCEHMLDVAKDMIKTALFYDMMFVEAERSINRIVNEAFVDIDDGEDIDWIV